MAGNAIERMRVGLKMTCHQFAESLGVSVDVIKAWEADRQQPSASAIAALEKLARDNNIAVPNLRRADRFEAPPRHR